MFIDYVEIKIRSGKGGDGMSSFRREKYVPKGGPDGGDGGRGAHVYFVADKNINTLMDFQFKKIYSAPDGGKGTGSNMHGANGKDLFIKIPAGTVIKQAGTGAVIKDLIKDAEPVLIAKGGRGGRGNARFKSSTRQAPRFYEKGEPGEEKGIILELKIIADAGIIGIANTGKSTLLSKISNARPKIADYPFTTLHPVLGIVRRDGARDIVVADIPGLIEGAAEGRGLGHSFLRHIERTKAYIHLVDPTQGSAMENYRLVNKELKAYSEKLFSRPQVVAINKTDLLTEKEKKKITADFKKAGVKIDFISAKEKIGLEKVINRVYNIVKRAAKEPEYEKPSVVESSPRVMAIERLEKNLYRLHGGMIEKYIATLDFKVEETTEVFRQYMKRHRIEEFLKAKGVKEGDIVVIGDRDFVYKEE